MERVLIVAKTHLGPEKACVSGLTRQTNKSVRLLTRNGSHQPADTPFEVGQVWEIESRRATHTTPPHVEDVRVFGEKYVGQQPDMRKTLLNRVHPWSGELCQLYDGLLVIGERGAYITRSNGIPRCSTGYWFPGRSLTLSRIDDRIYYEIEYEFDQGSEHRIGKLRVRYVGYAEPIVEIPSKTLVRVSLARWWRLLERDEERCYLQLSGWYV